MGDFFANLPSDENAEVPFAAESAESVSETEEFLRRHQSMLLGMPGVEGFAPGPDHLVVYVVDEEAASRLPTSVEGQEVRAVVTGEIRAQSAR